MASRAKIRNADWHDVPAPPPRSPAATGRGLAVSLWPPTKPGEPSRVTIYLN